MSGPTVSPPAGDAPAERASGRWFHRPLYRDWAVWAGLVVGLLLEVTTSRTRSVGVFDETPFFLLEGVVLVGLAVGTVRQFRIGRLEGATGDGVSAATRWALRIRRRLARR